MTYKIINPFFYTGINIPDKYFCDRQEETAHLSELILGGNNIVLKAPRRLGKSSLIFHLFNQKPFKKDYNTIYVDIYPTKTVEDFVAVFYKSIADCKGLSGRKELEGMHRSLKEVSASAEFTFPSSLKLSGSRQYDTYKVEKSLDVIFDFLAKTSKPNLIVIDEFQQIRNYENSNLEPSLRSFIQRSANCSFIFSGSSRHMLTQIFESSDKPFYRSSRTFNLGLIPEDRYLEFCKKHFTSFKKDISPEAVHLTYTLFSGNTFMMQQTMNSLFLHTERGATADVEDVRDIIESLVDEKSEDYRVYLHGLKQNYEKVLLCIASQGIASGLFSDEIRQRYGLPASSTISNILKSFQKEDFRVVEEISPNVYKLEDKLLELWAAKYIFGTLTAKFDTAEEMFEKERRIREVL